MSVTQVDLNPDFVKLQQEGYELEIQGTFLLVRNIPYFKDNKRKIEYGKLVCNIDLSGGGIIPPRSHVAYFIGHHPCDLGGNKISSIVNNSNRRNLGKGMIVDHMFSSKPRPTGRYESYYDKVKTYSKLISEPVKAAYPNYKIRALKPIMVNQNSVFHYLDTNSSRAEITALSDRLSGHKVGIIGLGGTGGYILDLVSKTPVSEIHLFDGDIFDQHNAFRAPGAISLEDLQKNIPKVEYLRKVYSNMHKFIYSHEVYITPENLQLLKGLDFVFISIDKGSIKPEIFGFLEEHNINFIDVGMGVDLIDESLIGMLRITTSTVDTRKYLYDSQRVSFIDDQADEYSTNIQIADLNSLNATLAVIKWKKLAGFYKDVKPEHHQSYSTHLNKISNGDF